MKTNQKDPHWYQPYKDPLSKHLSRLKKAPTANLGDPLAKFRSPGVYLLFYFGVFSMYLSFAAPNLLGEGVLPLYIGSSINDVWGRINSHFTTLTQVSRAITKYSDRAPELLDIYREQWSLAPEFFLLKFLTTTPPDALWIEKALQDHFHPFWNDKVRGFGYSKGDDARLRKRPDFDLLHPGRESIEDRKGKKWALDLDRRNQFIKGIRPFLPDYRGVLRLLD